MRFLLNLLPFRNIISIVSRLPQYLRLASRLMLDRRTPVLPKIVMAGALIYVISPFDLIPEFILPPLGYTEDLILFLFAVHNIIRSSPQEVVTEHARSIAGLDDESPPA